MITYAQVRPEKGLLELQQLHDADGLYIYVTARHRSRDWYRFGHNYDVLFCFRNGTLRLLRLLYISL